VLLASAAAAWCAWQFIPGTTIDRGLARLVSRTIAKPPIAISGSGGHHSPWILLRTSAPKTAHTSNLPVVSLGDDPEGIFQSSPPSPLDLAIVLKNMRRLGISTAGVSAVLAWEEPDVIALSALDSALASFDKVATAAPLSRGPTSSPLPPSFRRASIAADKARGNIADLPVVNRIPLPGIILGQDNALSGFTLLENEPDGIPLAARWDDRIIFAFPVVATIVRQGLSIDDIEFVPGSHIKLGPNGSVIPIDRYGRLISIREKSSAEKPVNAASLADTTEPLSTGPRKFALLRDDQSGAEPATRLFSENVAFQIEAMVSSGATPAAKIFQRAPASSELTLLGAISLAIAAASMRPRFSRHRMYALIGVAALALQFILAVTASFWFVALPILAASFSAFAVGRIFFRDTIPSVPTEKPAASPTEKPVAEPVTTPIPTAAPETIVIETITPEIPAPAEKTEPLVPAKKAAAKKAAKKTATKKTAAKKAATKKPAGKKATRAKKPKNSN